RAAATRKRDDVLRPDADPRGNQSGGGRGRARVAAGRQRVREVDDLEDGAGRGEAALRPRAVQGRRRDGLRSPGADQPRDGDRAGEPPAVRRHERAREPGAGGDAAPRRGPERGLRPSALAVPPTARAQGPARVHAFGRRATDGGDGPSADVEAQAAADGRTLNGPGAGAGAAELRDHQTGPRERRGRADGRAERDDGAVDSRPRLRAGDGRDRAAGEGRRPARERGSEAGLSRALSGAQASESTVTCRTPRGVGTSTSLPALAPTSARARGESNDSLPSDGAASNAETSVKVSSRPEPSSRRVTVVPSATTSAAGAVS